MFEASVGVVENGEATNKFAEVPFMQEKLVYLGFVIPQVGLNKDPRKVRAIVKWPIFQETNSGNKFSRFGKLLP